MSQRNPFGRSLAARLETIRAWASGRAARAAVLLTLVAGLMEAPGAAATYAVAFSVGSLLLIGVAAVARGVREPRRVLVECRRAPMHPWRDR